MNPPHKPKVAAYHEAGYAVMALRLRTSFMAVTIRPKGDCCGRLMHRKRAKRLDLDLESCRYARDRRWVETRIMVGFAGPEAQRRYQAQGHRQLAGASGDLANCMELAQHMTSTPAEAAAYFKWMRLRTINYMDGPHFWTAVETVAAALLDRGRLSHAEASDIYKRARYRLPRSLSERG
jgi:hypothetical protein